MTHKRTTRFWLDSLLCVITLICRDWIELVFHVDPDHGSGALEWSVVGGLLALCLVSATLARLESRHTSMQAS
jgi:hypothetical protein